MSQLSIIIPVFNEAGVIQENLEYLQQATVGVDTEIIVVDGGSTDKTAFIAESIADHVISAPKGRASQMNAGAGIASGEYLLFLHVDTRLPVNAFPYISTHSLSPAEQPSHKQVSWGFYRVKLSGRAHAFRIIETMMNWRASLTHVATGDQCLFVQKSLFDQLGGFAAIALMEDVEISKRLRRCDVPYVVKQSVVTSSRKWERGGIVKTICLMWYLRALYFFGVSPEYLVKKYYSAN